MIKYLGSKRTLVPAIVDAVRSCVSSGVVVDLFSGTSRVGHALKRAGYVVRASDHNAYAAALARCYVQADRSRVLADARRLVAEFNAQPGRAGYFTSTFCERSRYVQPFNGERIDAIREAIDRKGLEGDLRAVMLVSLMEAADRVDSTTGVQMAYLKSWSARSYNPIELRVPDVLERPKLGACEAHELDAIDAAGRLEGDVAYLDPPYNQHAYLGNYHVWETLVRADAPETYGVACKRTDCRDRRSVFNSRPRFEGALARVLTALRTRFVILSFSDEGYVTRQRLAALLDGCYPGARVRTLAVPYRRYVGARIGIYNPRGEKVGRVGHLTNTEFLFVVDRAPATGPTRPRRIAGGRASTRTRTKRPRQESNLHDPT